MKNQPDIIEGVWREVPAKKEPFFGPWRSILIFLGMIAALAFLKAGGGTALIPVLALGALLLRESPEKKPVRRAERHRRTRD